ncbi:hypothetical protein [Pigmentiphaga sp. NML080357]|uniref:hypothetical protein n=1 Tax=Pigmentiphaga sp. NML080357 TaxID=2008675 RepID=UPI0011867CE8|nr:hypothetical protein [Pigmentiphaga sp. NML080357]
MRHQSFRKSPRSLRGLFHLKQAETRLGQVFELLPRIPGRGRWHSLEKGTWMQNGKDEASVRYSRTVKNLKSYEEVRIDLVAPELDPGVAAKIRTWLYIQLIRGDLGAHEFFLSEGAQREWKLSLHMACSALGTIRGVIAVARYRSAALEAEY